MHLDTGKLIDVADDSSDEDDDDSTDNSYDSDDSLSNSSNVSNEDAGETSTEATKGTNAEQLLDLEEEEDELVKSIKRSKELHRNHPPTITVEDFVVDICFHPEEDLITLANIVGDVLLYKYNNDETTLVSTLELHLKACRCIKFSNDGKTLFSTAKDLSIMLTDLETEKLKRVYEEAHEQPVYSMTIIGENTFATGDDDGVVKLWDLRQQGSQPIFSIKKMEDYVSDMITNNEGKYLVCSSGDGSLTSFNLPAKKVHIQSIEYDEELTCLGLFKSERKLLTASSKGAMYVFNWEEFGLHSDKLSSFTKKTISCMVPITDNIVITGDEDGILRAMSIFPNRQLGVVGQHDYSVEALDVSNNGIFIASSSHDNDVKFWNVQYFEDINLNQPIKGGKQKQLKHNLPSSKVDNATDFFSDL
ncbi:WD repeat-containing protein 55 homolog [Prorops nasuta]|uniref:WD repeat-containing protein 55 homolog n=1 Tax=Prorops nasuta TaxID=863751 RepID=UPI0034CD83D8